MATRPIEAASRCRLLGWTRSQSPNLLLDLETQHTELELSDFRDREREKETRPTSRIRHYSSLSRREMNESLSLARSLDAAPANSAQWQEWRVSMHPIGRNAAATIGLAVRGDTRSVVCLHKRSLLGPNSSRLRSPGRSARASRRPEKKAARLIGILARGGSDSSSSLSLLALQLHCGQQAHGPQSAERRRAEQLDRTAESIKRECK